MIGCFAKPANEFSQSQRTSPYVESLFEYFDHVGFDVPALDNSKKIPAAWLGHYRIGQGTYDTDRALLDLTTWPPISRRIFELQQEKLCLTLYLDENAGLYQRLNRSVADAIAPYLARVIQSGIDEGVFHVPDAFATAELFLQISNSIHRALSIAINARGTNGAQKRRATLRLQSRFKAWQSIEYWAYPMEAYPLAGRAM